MLAFGREYRDRRETHMFDPVLLLQMAITAFIMLTLKTERLATESRNQKISLSRAANTQEIFTSQDGKEYIMHGGMWIQAGILSR